MATVTTLRQALHYRRVALQLIRRLIIQSNQLGQVISVLLHLRQVRFHLQVRLHQRQVRLHLHQVRRHPRLRQVSPLSILLSQLYNCLKYGSVETDECGNPVTPGTGGNSGIFTYKDVVNTGFLNASGAAAQGIYYRFDSCSQTVCENFYRTSKTYANSIFLISHSFTTRAPMS